MNKRASKDKTRVEWETPDSVFLPIRDALGLNLDVATSGASNSRCQYFLQGPCWGRVLPCTCGLCAPWKGYRVWCNPPYGQTEIPKWVEKAKNEFLDNGVISALLLPNNTETAWFEALWETCTDIVLLQGRVPFIAPPGHEFEGEAKSENTGGSIVAVYGDSLGRIAEDGRPNVILWRWKVDKYFPVRA